MLLWTVWHCRNHIRTTSKDHPISQVLPLATFSRFYLTHSFFPRVRWLPSTDPLVKVNFDGAMFRESREAGLGVIVCDSQGRALASLSKKVILPPSVDDVEALAVVKAIHFAQELGFSSIILEGDLEAVIKGFKSERRVIYLLRSPPTFC